MESGFTGCIDMEQRDTIRVGYVAIVGRPKLLLADEPTGNLHSEQGDEIMQLFKKLNDEGMTIIQVTHSEKNAQYGDRIIRLVDGLITSDTRQEEVEVN